jgi:hypothetical protein
VSFALPVSMDDDSQLPDSASPQPQFRHLPQPASVGHTSGLMPPVSLSGAAGDNTVRRGEPAFEPGE